MRRVAALLGAVCLAATTAAAVPPNYVVESVASGFDFSVSFAFTPDGRILVAELGGTIRVVDNGTVDPTPFASLSVGSSGEQGLLGIAVHPEFTTNGWVYVCFTTPQGGHEIGRFTASGNTGTGYTPIVTGLPGAVIHNGGNIAFGPDGKLYHTMGDNASSASSQNDDSYPGKIHRFNDDGTVPADNPYLDGLASRYCMGLRNSFDLCWNHDLALLYASENGSGDDDEVNRIIAAGNYGWPDVTCSGGGGVTAALTCWTPTIAPTGIAAYTGDNFESEYLNDLFVGDFNAGRIWRLDMTPDGLTFLDREVFHDEPTAILDVVDGPDGYLYFCTAGTLRRIRRVIDVPAPEITLCQAAHETVYLFWTNNGSGVDGAYETVEIHLDGQLLVSMPGDADQYVFLGAPEGTFEYAVRGVEGGIEGDFDSCSTTLVLTPFIRGDADNDGVFNGLADALYLLSAAFLGGPVPSCSDAADADDDSVVNGLTDATYMLAYGFLGGPAPPPPHPGCGTDTVPDSVGCDASACP